jgi:hypothetical protein
MTNSSDPELLMDKTQFLIFLLKPLGSNMSELRYFMKET